MFYSQLHLCWALLALAIANRISDIMYTCLSHICSDELI